MWQLEGGRVGHTEGGGAQSPYTQGHGAYLTIVNKYLPVDGGSVAVLEDEYELVGVLPSDGHGRTREEGRLAHHTHHGLRKWSCRGG